MLPPWRALGAAGADPVPPEATTEGSMAFMEGVTKVDDDTAERLRRHWDDGWNGEDVDTIMEPFADDIVFSSPFVSTFAGDPAVTTVEGHDALRAYVDAALRRSPGIRYSVDGTHLGSDTLVLLYTVRFPDGRPDRHGADLMRVDADGKVAEWRCHYEADS
jgi:hypothetical protein